MNAQMRIYVRVINAASPQLAQIQAQMRGLQMQTQGAAVAGGALGRASEGMLKWGKNMQWTGRQIEYNFTLPLVMAGAMAQKWANENETAFVRIQKVYGDASMSSQQMQSETKALRGAFVSLSNMTGIAQKDILDIAGDWAAAGSSGLALGKATRLTAEAMVLGEMSATDASKALISIQAQYGFTTGEINRNRAALEQQAKSAKGTGFQVKTLADTVAVLNMVENQTGVSFEGLVQGFQRAAGTARTAGVDVQHLAAFIAAMTPAAGSAAQAGNSLKTIFTRLLVPTKQASQLLGQIGINTRDAAWQSKSGTQRLEELAQAYTHLNPQQQMFLDKAIAGTYQISRFSVMMRSITDANGYYQKALKSTNSEAAVQLQYVKELGMVLDSQPNKFKILTTTIQNSMASAIIPLTPAILGILAMITRLAQGFANMDPRWQKLIMFSLLFLALLGPLLRYMGAFAALFGLAGKAVVILTTSMGWGIAGLRSLYTMLSLSSAWNIFVAGATGAARLVVVALTAIGPILMPFFSGLGSILSGLLSGGFFRTFVGGAIAGAWSTLMYTLTGILGGAGTAIAGLWRSIWAVLSTSTSTGGGILTRLWAWVMASIQLITAGVGGTLTMIWTATWASLSAITTFGGTALRAIMTGITFVLGPMWQALGAMLMYGWNVVWTFMSTRVNAAGVIGAVQAFFGGLYRMFMMGWAQLRTINLAGIFTSTVGIWVLAIGAVISLIVAFRHQIAQAFSGIVNTILRAFYALPKGVQNAFIAVINVVKAAINAVRHWLGYLNPFQRHSPSLVDNVNAGTAVIAKKYKGLSQSVISSLGGAKAAVDAQQAVVDRWKNALDAAQKAVDRAQKSLDQLQKVASAANDRLSASKDALDQWANTPIVGMRAMSDAIFNNEQASKRLQLQIMKLQDAGKGPDQLADKFSKLQGDIEALRGQSAELRAMGAGSDVLGPINAQIKATEKQADAVQKQQIQYGGLTEQLDKLQRQGQELDLENSLKFDPLTRQIDQMTKSMKEVPFGTIVAGIRQQQAAVAANQRAYDAASAAVDRQQAVVDRLKDAHDAISDTYDAENDQLQRLKDNYDKLNEAAQNAAAGLEKVKAAKVPDAVKDFNAAGNATAFPDPGQNAAIGREGGPGDQTAQIDQMAADWAKESQSAFGKIDMFGPFKDMFRSAVKWVDDHTGGWLTNTFNNIKKNPGVAAAAAATGAVIGGLLGGPIGAVLGAGVGAALTPLLSKLNIGGKFKALKGELDKSGVAAAFTGVGHAIGTAFSAIGDVIGKLWKLLGPDIMRLLDAVGHGLVYAFQQLGQVLGPIFKLIGPIGEAFGHIWTIIKPFVLLALTPLLFALKMLASVISNVVGPAFHFFVDLIAIPIKIATDIIGFFVSLINGDWGKAFHYLGKLFTDTFGGVGKIIKDGLGVAWGIVKGVVEGIVGFFKWLFDVLVGHSIVPDLVNAIIGWFLSLPGKIIKGFWDLGVMIVKELAKLPGIFFRAAGDAGKWLVDMGGKVIGGLIDGIGWAITNIPKAMEKVGEAIVNFFLGIPKWVSDSVIPKIGDFFGWITQLPGYLMSVDWGHVVGSIVDGIGNAISWIMHNPGTIAKYAGYIVGGLLLVIAGIPLLLVGGLLALAGGIVYGIVNGILQKMGTSIPDLARGIGHFLSGIPGFITDAGSWLWNTAGDMIGGFVGGIGAAAVAIWNWFTSLPGWIWGFVKGSYNWIKNNGGDLLRGFIDGIVGGAIAVWRWLGSLPGWIWGYVKGAYNWIKNSGISMLRGFVDGIVSAAVAVWNWFGRLPGNIWNMVKGAGSWIKQAGSNLIIGFVNGIGELAGRIWGALGDIARGIGNTFANAGSWLYNAGKNILIGLWNGIRDMGQWLADQLMRLIHDIIPDPIERVLHMNSPSRVTMEQGRNVVRGLAIGINDQAPMVARASAELAQIVVDKVTPSDMMRNAGLSYTQSFQQGLLNGAGGVLDAATSIASGVANTFASMPNPTLSLGLDQSALDYKPTKQNTQLPWQASVVSSGVYTSPRPNDMVSQSNDGSGSSGLTPPTTSTKGSGDIHINGNLEFPNITNPNDASEFINNLRALAK